MTKVVHGSLTPNITGPFHPFTHFAFTDLPAKLIIGNRLFVDEVAGQPVLYDGELDIDMFNDIEDLSHVDLKARWMQPWKPSKPWIRIKDLHSPSPFSLAQAWLSLNGGNKDYYDVASEQVTRILRKTNPGLFDAEFRNWVIREMNQAGIYGYVYANEREGKGTDAICVVDGGRVQRVGMRSLSMQEIAETFISTPVAVNILPLNEYEQATEKARMAIPS